MFLLLCLTSPHPCCLCSKFQIRRYIFDSYLVMSCSYLHDIIYTTSFVQVMSIISAKFWYIYLVVRSLYSYFLVDMYLDNFSSGSVNMNSHTHACVMLSEWGRATLHKHSRFDSEFSDIKAKNKKTIRIKGLLPFYLY